MHIDTSERHIAGMQRKYFELFFLADNGHWDEIAQD